MMEAHWEVVGFGSSCAAAEAGKLITCSLGSCIQEDVQLWEALQIEAG